MLCIDIFFQFIRLAQTFYNCFFILYSMTIPSWTADSSLYESKVTGYKQIQYANFEGIISTAACQSITGRCRGCVQLGSETMCCPSISVGYPWIEICGPRVRKGCGFCLWMPTPDGGGRYVPDLSSKG
jgi:hypothetical protein